MVLCSAQVTYGLASDSRLGFGPVKNMYAGEAYIGNHRTGNNAVSNTITKHLGYGIGDYDLIRTVRVWSPGYILDDDGNYPEGMF